MKKKSQKIFSKKLKINILILCRVVDNFGDAGFCLRLLRAFFSQKNSKKFSFTLAIDNLSVLKKLEPKIFEISSLKKTNFSILNSLDFCASKNFLKKNPPHAIIETFQCGRPFWLDDFLAKRETQNLKNPILILNADYLTAESYAEDFHLLKAATQFSLTKKFFFMPGFSKNTGGLILSGTKKNLQKKIFKNFFRNFFCVTIFSYEQDFFPIINALCAFQNKSQKKILAIVASSKNEKPFLSAWRNFGEPFQIFCPGFLPQVEWDFFIFNSDFNFVRGEDSLSRAALSGVPFLLHAYPQEKNAQKIKTQALIKKIFPLQEKNENSLAKIFSELFQTYNESKKTFNDLKKIEHDLFFVLCEYKNFLPYFKQFSVRLKKNGDFAKKILKTISDFFENDFALHLT